jgi:hypothetical protein
MGMRRRKKGEVNQGGGEKKRENIAPDEVVVLEATEHDDAHNFDEMYMRRLVT